MCITAYPAKLGNTRIYAGEVYNGKNTTHCLMYTNEPENHGSGPNCMLLHIPSSEKMTENNMIKAEGGSDFIEDVIRKTRKTQRSRGMKSISDLSLPDNVEIFERGMYTVILTNDPMLIPQALSHVPENKRPEIPVKFMEFYRDNYPGWTVALCCFDNADRVKAEPLMFQYKPMFTDRLFAPGIDAHDGSLPKIGKKTHYSHEVVFGTSKRLKASQNRLGYGKMTYRHDNKVNTLEESLKPLWPYNAIHESFSGSSANGDFCLKLSTLDREKRGGIFRTGKNMEEI